jgi:predicted RND superfamily exporter protein
VIAVALAITLIAAAAIALRGVKFDGSPETLVRQDSELEFFNEVRTTFGDDRVIIVALTTGDVFTPAFIEKLDRLTSRLGELEGVASTLSLTNIKTIRRVVEDGASEVRIEGLIPRPATAEALRSIKAPVTGDPLYAKQYVSLDGRTAAVSLFLGAISEEQARGVAREVERITREEAGPDEVMLAGVPVMDHQAINSMVRDMLVISVLAILLCFAVFLVSFRSAWGAGLPTATILIGMMWITGLMTLIGRPVTFATLPLPTVLMVVGSSYIFHVLNQYRISMSQIEAGAEAAVRRAAWIDGVNFIGPAVLVSATTTMAGFGSLASSQIPTVRDMGAFEAIGTFFMLGLSLVFIPAVLARLSPQALGRTSELDKDYATWLNGLLKQVTALVLFRRRAVLVASLAITLLVGAGAIWLRVNTDYLRIFPESSDTAQSARKLHERLSGAASVQVVVTGRPGAVTQPDFIESVGSLEEYALTRPGVDAAVSVADIVKRFGEVLPFTGQDLSGKQEWMQGIFDNYLSQDETLSRLVSKDYSRAIIVLRTNLFGSNELRQLTQSIEAWGRQNLKGGATARATGTFILLNDASDAVAASQLSSLALAIVTIYMMMVVLFRSFSTGLLALIPNLLPLVCFFGFLGWTGITLDITTSLVASASLGLAVDNAVHMIRRYRQCSAERDSGGAGDEGWAMWLTLLRTGKPMVLANGMLVAAHMLFMLSSFAPVKTAGMLWAVTIFSCLVADLILLPVLMKTRLFARAALGHMPAKSVSISEQEFTGMEEEPSKP